MILDVLVLRDLTSHQTSHQTSHTEGSFRLYLLFDFHDNLRPQNSSIATLQKTYHYIMVANFNIIRRLGKGGFSEVNLIQCQHTKQKYALKKVDLTDLDTETIKQLNEEASLLEKIEDTRFIIQLFSYKITTNFALLFLEPCLCGDLWTLMQTNGPLPEQDAKFYVGCVIEGLEHLQKLQILFRDLKPENMLLGQDGYVKIADFGMSKTLAAGEKTNTLVGTAEYLAPEMLTSKDGYDDRATLWSLGILLFELLTGSPPFTSNNRSILFSKIAVGFKGFSFPPQLSSTAVEIVQMLCRIDPKRRSSLQMIRRFMWFSGFSWEDLRAKVLPAPWLPELTEKTMDDTSLRGF